MTVAELKDIIEDLPDDMEIFMPLGEDALISVCFDHSGTAAVATDHEEQEIMILVPCTCDISSAIDFEINPN